MKKMILSPLAASNCCSVMICWLLLDFFPVTPAPGGGCFLWHSEQKVRNREIASRGIKAYWSAIYKQQNMLNFSSLFTTFQSEISRLDISSSHFPNLVFLLHSKFNENSRKTNSKNGAISSAQSIHLRTCPKILYFIASREKFLPLDMFSSVHSACQLFLAVVEYLHWCSRRGRCRWSQRISPPQQPSCTQIELFHPRPRQNKRLDLIYLFQVLMRNMERILLN